jgi:hypothetical protein
VEAPLKRANAIRAKTSQRPQGLGGRMVGVPPETI